MIAMIAGNRRATMISKTLAETLHLSENCEDEEASAVISTWIISATQDESPKFTVADLYRLLAQTGSAHLLDALAVLPMLISYPGQSARDLIALVGECSSAKEVVIAVEEALERVNSALMENAEDDEDDKEKDGLSGDPKTPSPITQLITVLSLCCSTVPRLKYRNKPPEVILRPLVTDLRTTLQLASSISSLNTANEVISQVSSLVCSAAKWARDQSEAVNSEQELLRSLLDSTVEGYSKSGEPILAQKAFALYFPRFVVPRYTGGSSSQQDADKFLEPEEALKILELSVSELFSSPSVPSLIYLALILPNSQISQNCVPPSFFEAFLPPILTSLSTNVALDENLSVLLRTLSSSTTRLPSTVTIPLVGRLSPICSAHPHSGIRHITFRTLALVLERSEPRLHLQLLRDLVVDEDFPQMRAAAVGLVKEAVLRAVTPSIIDSGDSRTKDDSIFASNAVLQVLGTTLFRPMPYSLFEGGNVPSVRDFVESLEMGREVECLGLYYVMLMRDVNNQTGIRSKQFTNEVEMLFLGPLRRVLAVWVKEDFGLIGPLVLAVETVDVALKTICSSQ